MANCKTCECRCHWAVGSCANMLGHCLCPKCDCDDCRARQCAEAFKPLAEVAAKALSRHPGLVIRFDGPPSHESGRFVEVELDGASISIGEWKQDGDHWLLVMPPAIEAAARPGISIKDETLLRVISERNAALLQIGELKAENGKLFDMCDEQGKTLGTICDERGEKIQELERLIDEYKRADAMRQRMLGTVENVAIQQNERYRKALEIIASCGCLCAEGNCVVCVAKDALALKRKCLWPHHEKSPALTGCRCCGVGVGQ